MPTVVLVCLFAIAVVWWIGKSRDFGQAQARLKSRQAAERARFIGKTDGDCVSLRPSQKSSTRDFGHREKSFLRNAHITEPDIID